MLHLRRVLLACTLALAPSAAPLRSATLYVSTHGRSGWSGRLPAPGADGSDGPLPSLDSARDAVRELRRRGETGPVEVLLRGGVYPLDAPFVLGPDDSGSPGAPVVYAAYPGERPVLSGSRLVRGWRREAGALWTARLPSSTLPRQSPRQLFVGGRRAQRARAPNHGFLRIPGPSSKDARFRLPFAPGSIPSAWAGREVEAIVLLGWTSLRRPIVEVDEARGVAALAGDSGGSSVARVEGIDARFYLENAREALDAEGEWFYDRQAGIVSCWPRGGEDLARDPVTVSAIPVLVRLEGRPEAGRSVHDVTLRGLAFRETNWEMGATGFADHPQAAVEIPAAVEADGAERCTVEECTFSSLGGYAVAFGRAARANRVTGNTMRDLGAGGVKLGATELPAPSEESFENLVADNHIHDIGVVYPGAVGILVLQSSRNAIVHNLIHDTNYTGISVGWTWGYAENRCRGNRIESNVLHHIARGMLDDLGAIYTLGVQPGTVIRNNVIHDVEPFSMRGRGIYLDEGSTDILVENNVVSRVRSAGFHQHYGRDNVVRNNIFAFNGDAQVSRARAEAHRSYTFERNLVVFSSGRLLGGSWNDAGFHFARNLYHDLRGAPLGFGRFGWDEWRARGQDEGSVVADPRLADAAGGDFALPPDSPARAVGFRPIDATLAGIRPTPHGTRVIRDLEYARPGGKPLLLDLYLPEKAAQKLPVVVSIHGGGWHGGQKERSPGFALAASGYAVASIDYRLTGEATFPAQIEDCKAAVRWLRAEAGRYGLDPERFGAWGTSAGGHLAALLGTSGGVAELEGNLGNAGQSSRVQAVVDFFGPVDTAAWYRHKGETQAGLIGAPVAGSEARLARANPATYVDRADPPFLVAHGRRDTLVPAAQSEAFAEALRRAGVPVTLELVAGAGHSAPELRLDEVVRAFFDRHLRDRP